MEAIGVTFGKYTLLRKIAEGGMAEIFLANQGGLRGFSKLVVIKRILAEYSKDPLWSEMFLDEARLAATLTHPNIVQVFDAGAVDGTLYIAMEYLAGEDVRHVVRALAERDRGMALEQALTIVAELCKGLDHAHDKTYAGQRLEIVHRDVSPRNVVITLDGNVKVLDFGIAKAANKLTETRVGLLKGSLAYMSPEQARSSDRLDRRSDVFSVGIVLHELTTGRRLFKARGEYEILQKVVSDPIPRPGDLVPHYPVALEAIVMRCLQRDPAARFQSCRELNQELEAFGRSAGLALGPSVLRQLMESLFNDRVSAMREAERMGQDLAAFAAPGEESISVSDMSSLTMDSLKPASGRTTPEPVARPMTWRARALMAGSLVVLTLAVGALFSQGEMRRPGSPPIITSRALAGSVADAFPEPRIQPASTGPRPEASPAVIARTASSTPALRAELPSPRRAEIELLTRPPGARVLLGDRELGVTPTRFHLAVGSDRQRIRLVLAGHEELVEELVADRDLRLERMLTPLKVSTEARPRRMRRVLAEKVAPRRRVIKDLVDPFQ